MAQKEFFCPREKAKLWQLQLFPTGKEAAVFPKTSSLRCQDSLSARRAFFNGDYKKTNTETTEVWHKPSKDYAVSWGRHYSSPKEYTQLSFPLSLEELGQECHVPLPWPPQSEQLRRRARFDKQVWLRLDACNHSRALQNKPFTNFATNWQHPLSEHLKGCGELKNWYLTTVTAGNLPGVCDFHDAKHFWLRRAWTGQKLTQKLSFKVRGWNDRNGTWKSKCLHCLEDKVPPLGGYHSAWCTQI